MMSRTSPPFPTENEKSMSEKVTDVKDKLAAHIKGHKELYIGLGAGIMIGAIGGGTVLARKPDVEMVQKFKALVNFNWKSTQIMSQQSMKALGHPGFRVRNNETGAEYPSINNAAMIEEVSKSKLAQHLHGKFPDIDGNTYSILGLMMTPVPTSATTW